MSNICQSIAPFKIFHSVIITNIVNMIYLRKILMIWQISFCDHSMHINFFRFCSSRFCSFSSFQSNYSISISIRPRGYFFHIILVNIKFYGIFPSTTSPSFPSTKNSAIFCDKITLMGRMFFHNCFKRRSIIYVKGGTFLLPHLL